jgi:hypothetical protein
MSASQDSEVRQGGLPCPESVMGELKLAMKEKHYVACIVCSRPAIRVCEECNETLYCSDECLVHDEPIHDVFCGKPKAHSLADKEPRFRGRPCRFRRGFRGPFL